MKKLKHIIKKLQWKITRGYTCCDAVGANYWIAEKIIPIIRNMAERTASYPPDITFEEWKQTLTDIADGFQACIDEDESFDMEESKRLKLKTRKGLSLFAKYYDDLWM